LLNTTLKVKERKNWENEKRLASILQECGMPLNVSYNGKAQRRIIL